MVLLSFYVFDGGDADARVQEINGVSMTAAHRFVPPTKVPFPPSLPIPCANGNTTSIYHYHCPLHQPISSSFNLFNKTTMADSNPSSKFQSMREWVVEHKLRAVGSLWLSGIAGSIAYNWSQPGMKTSVRIIHARLHAQALTLAALAGAAVVEYYDHKSGAKSERYAKFLPPIDSYSHKD